MSEVPQSRKEERLTSIRKRIAILRSFLESSLPILSIGISSSGGSMTMSVDRKGATEELAQLEREERNIMKPNRWFRTIDMGGSW